ncbi:DUF5946 family protein [Herbidospora mongoliensis]|uniref:DUF5946 family protein n=1 Tax=Herbidospora mongoliensis TaxID=688067 RepID=UPI0012FC2E0D|nr:DUF5946 family protein [Herbidospora mongoliensis]
MTCVCGAASGPLGECADHYYAILAEEQADPVMYRWHNPVVCAYLLQHPGDGHAQYLDVQFRWLQLLLDQGLDAMLRVQAHQIARNGHKARRSYDMAPFEKYAPLPQTVPGHFSASFSGLPVIDGSFVSDGHEAYGRRIEMIAEATVRAWTSS